MNDTPERVAEARRAVSIQQRELIDTRLTDLGEPCEACGHRMIRFCGQCWSDCGCISGKHAVPVAAGGGDTGGHDG